MKITDRPKKTTMLNLDRIELHHDPDTKDGVSLTLCRGEVSFKKGNVECDVYFSQEQFEQLTALYELAVGLMRPRPQTIMRGGPSDL